jgi:phosphotransferase system HPr (HPr) family protein
MTTQLKIKVSHPAGLHARPASLFVQTANKFGCDIEVKNLTDESDIANAKSILTVLTLGVMQDHEIEITAEGEDAEEAVAALKELIESNFGED